tara:strand:- start:351 stop:893 length:543 start_codon:yes stop_codon:yes gene_type:complete
MGFFDDIASTFKKGVKAVGSLVKKGVKAVAPTIKKGVKLAEEVGKGLGKAENWEKGLRDVGTALQYPLKKLKEVDPLAKEMEKAGIPKFLSPLSLAGDIAYAPVDAVGHFTRLAGDKKMQKKLKSGDMDAVLDTTFAGLSFIPVRGLGAAKAGLRGTKSVAKGSAKSAAKTAVKAGSTIF